MKTCTKCDSNGPFFNSKSTKDGLDYWCKKCRTKANLEYKKKNPDRIKELNNESQKRRFLIEKLAAISAYGGSCTCCFESDPHFLTLEHKNGVPDEHRLPSGKRVTALAMLRKIRKAGYPDEFTILCWNCNCARAYFGFCPHQPHDEQQRRYPNGPGA